MFMWQGQDKTWLHYVKDIIAADVYSAVFLASYLRQGALRKSYVPALEIIDLQKYKVVTDVKKVARALRERVHIPFVFVVGKN
jgi:hypothetical protein